MGVVVELFELGGSGRKFVLALLWRQIFIYYKFQGSVQAEVLECCSQIKDLGGYVVLVIFDWD